MPQHPHSHLPEVGSVPTGHRRQAQEGLLWPSGLAISQHLERKLREHFRGGKCGKIGWICSCRGLLSVLDTFCCQCDLRLLYDELQPTTTQVQGRITAHLQRLRVI